MSVVVYALMEGPAAQAAQEDLRRERVGGAANHPHVLSRAPLEGNALPEAATEFGRNLVLAMAVGAIVLGAAGGIAGALDVMPGIAFGPGLALGAISGLLIALMTAMQAGTRIAKAPLRALEPRLVDGRAVLVIEVDDRSEAQRAMEILERHAPLEMNAIGGF